jgi:hypothetical protein
MSATKEVMGGEPAFVTVMKAGMVVVLLPAVFVAPSDTEYDPTELNVYTGFWSVDVPPSPKVQYHPVGVLLEVSVNWTIRGRIPEVTLAVKDATGTAAFTVIYPGWDTVLLPMALDAVRVTV